MTRFSPNALYRLLDGTLFDMTEKRTYEIKVKLGQSKFSGCVMLDAILVDEATQIEIASLGSGDVSIDGGIFTLGQIDRAFSIKVSD
jgi:hypothetical protein